MSRTILLAVTTAATVAAMSLAAVPSAEARKHKHHHHKHRWGGVSVVVGAPIVYGGYRYGSGYSPYYYRGHEPYCRRFGWVYSRSGKAKWRCVAW
jgi:hypothetical protein